MITFNLGISAAAALVPLITGAIWYNPKVFGNIWIKHTGLSEEQLKQANMPLIFGLTYVFSFILALILHTITIHQFGYQSVMQGEPGFGVEGSDVSNMLNSFMSEYGNRFRTFKHGLLHGAIGGIFIAMPILGVNALFERKKFAYILLHTGYWMLTMALMCGIICQWS